MGWNDQQQQLAGPKTKTITPGGGKALTLSEEPSSESLWKLWLHRFESQRSWDFFSWHTSLGCQGTVSINQSYDQSYNYIMSGLILERLGLSRSGKAHT